MIALLLCGCGEPPTSRVDRRCVKWEWTPLQFDPLGKFTNPGMPGIGHFRQQRICVEWENVQ